MNYFKSGSGDPGIRGSGLLEDKTSKNSDNFVFKVAEFAFAV
jgi:hypothetical protein